MAVDDASWSTHALMGTIAPDRSATGMKSAMDPIGWTASQDSNVRLSFCSPGSGVESSGIAGLVEAGAA